MRAAPDSQVLLTASDIQKLEAEHAQLTAEIDQIDAQRREVEARRVAAAAKLSKIRELLEALGLSARLPASQGQKSEDDGELDLDLTESKSPWPPEILSRLRKGPYQSLDTLELRNQIDNGPLGNLLKTSDKGYYHTIRRLALRNEITKAHGRFFITSGLKQYEADLESGVASSFEQPIVRRSPMAEHILEFVAASRGGVRARDILGHVLLDERFVGPVKRNNSAAYNVLARLLNRGQLVRNGSGFYVLPEKNEAPT